MSQFGGRKFASQFSNCWNLFLFHFSSSCLKQIEAFGIQLEDILKEGEVVKFKVVGRDDKTGKIKLSRKVLMPKPEGYVERPERSRGDRGDRGRDRGPRSDRGRDRGPRGDQQSSSDSE